MAVSGSNFFDQFPMIGSKKKHSEKQLIAFQCCCISSTDVMSFSSHCTLHSNQKNVRYPPIFSSSQSIYDVRNCVLVSVHKLNFLIHCHPLQWYNRKKQKRGYALSFSGNNTSHWRGRKRWHTARKFVKLFFSVARKTASKSIKEWRHMSACVAGILYVRTLK